MNHLKVGALALAAFMLCASPAFMFTGLIGFAQAQDAPVVVTDPVAETTTVTTSAEGDDTTIINTPEGEATTIEMPDTTTVVSVPYGNWLSDAASALRDVAITLGLALSAWLFRSLPKTLLNKWLQEIVEKNMIPAINSGINAVEGAVRGQVLTIDVGSSVVAHAAQYFVDHAPGWLVTVLGGPEKIRGMVLARIPLESAATAQKVANALSDGPRPPRADW